MDSGNSGSLQSSSGGDEEYDSRAAAESFSAFISHPTRLPLQPPPPPFDPVSNYYFQIQNSNSTLFNPNIFLPRNMNPRSDQEAYSNHHPNDDRNILNSPFMASFQPATTMVSDRVGQPPLPPPPETSPVADNRTQNQNQTAARNPKKRSRASRRAPTTVLTTDTTNFRAMVQEFTGIPAPPFNSSAPFQRSRLDDLFSNTPLTSMIRSQPPLIHRPFSQKVQSPPPQPPPPRPLPPPFLASTNSTSSSTSNNAAASSSTPPSSHHHYHHLSNDQSSNLFNISNPVLTSFLQNNPKFPFSNSINLGSKIQGPFQVPSNDHSNNKIGELDEFSIGHGSVSPNLNALPNLISSDQIQPRRNNHRINNDTSGDDLTRWRNNVVSPDEIDHDQAQTRLIHGNYNFSRNSRNGKMNHLGSTSNFHGEKEQENVANRSEGMVESWICSSE